MEPNVAVAPNGRIDVTWLDFRNDYTLGRHPHATSDSKAQDVYFTRAWLGAAPSFTTAASSATTATKVAWALGGAALALLLAGCALFLSRSTVSGA